MENKKIFGLLSLTVIALLGVSFVAAYQGDYSTKGPNYSDDRHEAMTLAFENVDYDAWVALMSESGRHPRVLDIVTADNFDKFVEAHEAGRSGNFDRAAELKAELGLGNGVGPRDGTGFKGEHGMKKGSMQGSGMKGQNCLA